MASGDDEDFAALMRQQDVQPLAGSGKTASGKSASGKPAFGGAGAGGSRSSVAPAASSLGGRVGGAVDLAASLRRVDDGLLRQSQAELAAAQRQVLTLQGALVERDAAAAALALADQGRDAESARLQAELGGLREQCRHQEAALVGLGNERDAVDRERRKVAQALSERERGVVELQRRIAAADASGLWRERGLRDGGARIAALRALLDAAGDKVIDALNDPDRDALQQLLERLVCCCDDERCQPSRDTPQVRVAKAACEICGGSDVQRAFVDFVAACEAGSYQRVTFVGGSPAYREALRGLGRSVGRGLQLNFVHAERPGEGKRAQAVNGLVVIWGGTEVDHTTTGHYQAMGDRCVAVSHRGVAGMLALVTAKLTP